MTDITGKTFTLRRALAQAIVKVGSIETITAIEKKKVPKGDVYEMAKAACLLAVKRTSEMIPDCHPIPVEYTAVNYEIKDKSIVINVELKTVYKTGVEVEAMHGASVAALTIYDMLKPLDKNIEISTIKLVEKQGGKSGFADVFNVKLKIAVIVCSDSVYAGKKNDTAGKSIVEKLKKYNLKVPNYTVIPDEIVEIRKKVLALCSSGYDMVILTGGTGLSARDVTPEALTPILDKLIPGIAEAARNYGQDRTPYSMLSRSICGIKGKTLILALPGSTRGAGESIDALFPQVLHIFKVMENMRHD